MAFDFTFTEEEMVVNETLGYPTAYAKLCRDRSSVGVFAGGPPSSFSPYSLKQDEMERAEDFEMMFPIIDPKAKPTTKPKIFVNLLWKQLSHLGNAGFDPAVIRVDPYGNVVYYHADSASPLAWEIDHWFPCSRGGLTVASNLRILQWQACEKKLNKLEFLIPWWDLQLGISVNQFLSIFASANLDFRHRAFSFLFFEGENEEVNTSQTVDSHTFPNRFLESKERVGLAPAAIVFSRKELRTRHNNQWPLFPAAASNVTAVSMKENVNTDQAMNPYQVIVMARDSLKHKEDRLKMQSELQELDEEVYQMKRKNEEEKLALQDLELTLIKKKRRAEKSRRLAEAQSSYRTMLEKMIRDAMHQSVIYKEQVRLNQAAANALMARLEAQKAICDASERELHKIHKHKDEIEKQIRPELEQARKRSRMDETLIGDGAIRPTLRLTTGSIPKSPSSHKELRTFLEEEQKAYMARLTAANKERKKVVKVNQQLSNTDSDEEKIEKDETSSYKKGNTSVIADDEDGESRKQRGKENVERWLQMLLDEKDETHDESSAQPEDIIDSIAAGNIKSNLEKEKGDEISVLEEGQESLVVQQREESNLIKVQMNEEEPPKAENVVSVAAGGNKKPEDKERKEKGTGKEKGLARSESARILRRIPSSPSIVIEGLKKGVNCIRKKPLVFDEIDGDENRDPGSNFKSSFSTIKKSVKL